jgi:hypothetical protein
VVFCTSAEVTPKRVPILAAFVVSEAEDPELPFRGRYTRDGLELLHVPRKQCQAFSWPSQSVKTAVQPCHSLEAARNPRLRRLLIVERFLAG